MAKILVTMPDDFLHRVDGIASNEQRSRSELIRGFTFLYETYDD